jgi:hypothetical protein
LKYDGEPFSANETLEQIKKIIGKTAATPVAAGR